jgi:hypothetical protein
MTWQANLLETTRTLRRYALEQAGQVLSVAETYRAWAEEPEFRRFYNALLAAVKFAAFRWETPAVTRATLDQPFEFVVLDSPGLARRVDAAAFAEHFSATDSVVTFPNLSGDAQLIAPCPRTATKHYGHLADFVRHAPESQRDDFWRVVGETMQQSLSDDPLWLNTAGMGIAWLHLRLDSRPKYYHHQPYRSFPYASGH